MSVLKNKKHERFAQLVSRGFSYSDALRKLGSKSKDPSKIAENMLKRDPLLRLRIEELKAEVAAKVEAERQKELGAVVGSKLWVEKVLVEVVQRSMQYVPVLDAEGNQVFIETPNGQIAAAFAFDAKAATAAVIAIGKERGMFTPKFALPPSIFDSLPPEAVLAIRNGLTAIREGRLIEHDPNSGEPAVQPRLADHTTH